MRAAFKSNYPAFSVETERERGRTKVVMDAAGANFRAGATSANGGTNGGWLSTDSGPALVSVRTTCGL